MDCHGNLMRKKNNFIIPVRTHTICDHTDLYECFKFIYECDCCDTNSFIIKHFKQLFPKMSKMIDNWPKPLNNNRI